MPREAIWLTRNSPKTARTSRPKNLTYRKSLEADPKFYEARATLAAFLLNRDRASAETEACTAAQEDPHREAAWVTLTEAAIADQCWDEMFALLDAAKAAVPESREAEYAAGVALVRIGMHYRWAVQFLEHYEGPNSTEAKAKLAEARQKESLSR